MTGMSLKSRISKLETRSGAGLRWDGVVMERLTGGYDYMGKYYKRWKDLPLPDHNSFKGVLVVPDRDITEEQWLELARMEGQARVL